MMSETSYSFGFKEVLFMVPHLLRVIFGIVDSTQVRLTCKQWNEALLIEIQRAIKSELGRAVVSQLKIKLIYFLIGILDCNIAGKLIRLYRLLRPILRKQKKKNRLFCNIRVYRSSIFFSDKMSPLFIP
jgi:hypothetical protein